MSIQTFRKYGEINVIHKDGNPIALNTKFIPSINEVGICIEDASVNANYSVWLDLAWEKEKCIEKLNEEFPWLAEGEVSRLVDDIKEWAK